MDKGNRIFLIKLCTMALTDCLISSRLVFTLLKEFFNLVISWVQLWAVGQVITYAGRV